MSRRNLIRIALLAVVSSITVAASTGGAQYRTAEAAEQSAPDLAVFTPPPVPPTTEIMRLRDGMAAADARDWIGLALQRDRAEDPVVRRMLQWRYAIEDRAPLEFDPLSSALEQLADWPGRASMRQRAEKAIFTSRLNPSQRIAFLRQDNGPLSGDGRIALAQALRAAGNRQEAIDIARAAWREDTLTADAERVAQSEFADDFSAEDHAARVEILLWRGDRSGAARLFPRISNADRLLGQARIALQTRQRRGLQAAVDAVPASRRDDPSLLYDRTWPSPHPGSTGGWGGRACR
jgi:soluble lytic murein transglycosylase